MVDRYCITTAGIYNTSMGEWVKAADYEALEAKLARLVNASISVDKQNWDISLLSSDQCGSLDNLKAAIDAVKGR